MSLSAARRRERADLIKFTSFLLIAGLFTYWVGVVTSAHRPGDRVEYRAIFKDISGLETGDDVRIAGVNVGKVAEIEVRPDTTVMVRFTVPRNQPLNVSSEATIQYRNLIGDRVMQLTRPDPKARAMAAGEAIPSSRTRAALDLDTLLNGFKPLFEGLSPKEINAFSNQLVQVLQGQSSAIATVVQRAGSFTSSIAQRQELIGQVIRNLNTVMGTFDGRRDSVALLIDQLSALVDGLEKQDTQVLNSAARINTFARTASSLLRNARTDLKPDLVNLATTARGLNKKDKELNAVLDQLPKHYRAIQDTASYGNFFNFFLCGVRVQTGDNTTTPWIYSEAARCQR